MTNSNSNTKRIPIPMEEVMAWLQANHPNILAEAERSWLWIVADLRGEQHNATRESLKAHGFKFAKHGHSLPSGQTSYWAHSCDKPIAFKHKGGGGKMTPQKNNGGRKASRTKPTDNSQRVDPMEYTPQQPIMDEATMAQLAAAFA